MNVSMHTSKDILEDEGLLEEIWWRENENWSEVRERILSHRRWTILVEKIFEEKIDHKGIPRYLRIVGSVPATEMQDGTELCPSAKWVTKTTKVVEDYV